MKNPAAVALGKRGGSITSDRKAAASRENGKKGGRPRKKRYLVVRREKLRTHPGLGSHVYSHVFAECDTMAEADRVAAKHNQRDNPAITYHVETW